MNCPKCRSADFSEFKTEGVTMDFCSDCKGVWFDQGELAFYLETSQDLPGLRLADMDVQQSDSQCPKCEDLHLIQLPYMRGKDLMIEYCQSCQGIFLDAGEIGLAEKLSASLPAKQRLAAILTSLSEQGYSTKIKIKA